MGNPVTAMNTSGSITQGFIYLSILMTMCVVVHIKGLRDIIKEVDSKVLEYGIVYTGVTSFIIGCYTYLGLSYLYVNM